MVMLIFEEDYLPETTPLPVGSFSRGNRIDVVRVFATQMFRFDIICQSEIQIIPSKNKMVPTAHDGIEPNLQLEQAEPESV